MVFSKYNYERESVSECVVVVGVGVAGRARSCAIPIRCACACVRQLKFKTVFIVFIPITIKSVHLLLSGMLWAHGRKCSEHCIKLCRVAINLLGVLPQVAISRSISCRPSSSAYLTVLQRTKVAWPTMCTRLDVLYIYKVAVSAAPASLRTAAKSQKFVESTSLLLRALSPQSVKQTNCCTPAAHPLHPHGAKF